MLLFSYIPKGFFPEQDTGRIMGRMQASQDISFQAMSKKLTQVADIIKTDPDVADVTGFTGGAGGGATTNIGRMFIALKPFEERKASATEIIGRLRKKLVRVPGAPTYLQAVQELRIGGMMSNAAYQYTLRSDNLADLNAWAPRVLEQALRSAPVGGCQQRPAEQGAASHGGNRPPHGIASRHNLAAHRRHPLRRFRPGPGRNQLHHI